ncbi:sigma-70 family RNA polymerase sigma factor [Salipiger sp. P9]|uniref:sigma-70 family RNA polymerase sigma factor n=1 Tax=Salipiger pentaromativorans TaxID=2943193 RepID=UPI00215847FC|nr:sigma-70 family RNA polymerase sigma factor [Salipiger pentaromativorans]MCR8550311.1 sigma-70 family RNA polymerase sigma factor [Salipiger pentaromativorans]
MTDETEELSALLARVALRDRRAFQRLYDAAAPRLFAICLRMLKDRSEAEDALQEVFVRIWHNAGRYRPERGNAMAWLNTVARNHAIDRLRSARRGALGIEVAEVVADPGPGPEASAISRSETRRIEDCMSTLMPDRAEAVRLAYLDGASYLELSERYAIPLNTLRSWLRRSLLQLRRCLTP